MLTNILKMTTIRLIQFLLIGLLFGCSTSPVTSQLESRVIYSFDLDSLVKKETYNLNILRKDTILVYKYINTLDSTKNMTFVFNIKSEVLTFGPFDFKKAEDNFYTNAQLSSLNFDLYDLKIPVMDGNGPMLFNENYGILNVDNTSWTYQYLFLPTGQESHELAGQIMNKLKK